MTGIDTNTSNNTLDAAIFMASDPEDEKVTLTLMGDDAGSFELADDPENVNDARQVLSFKEKTDFEMPGDRNEDNVYEVTVRASDGGTLYADRMLIIKVINDADEGGKVTLSPEDAVVGVELTATLAHMEGGVSASGQITNPMWQWQRAAVPGVAQTCADVTVWADITDDATDATYTPGSEDRNGSASPPRRLLECDGDLRLPVRAYDARDYGQVGGDGSLGEPDEPGSEVQGGHEDLPGGYGGCRSEHRRRRPRD